MNGTLKLRIFGSFGMPTLKGDAFERVQPPLPSPSPKSAPLDRPLIRSLPLPPLSLFSRALLPPPALLAAPLPATSLAGRSLGGLLLIPLAAGVAPSEAGLPLLLLLAARFLRASRACSLSDSFLVGLLAAAALPSANVGCGMPADESLEVELPRLRPGAEAELPASDAVRRKRPEAVALYPSGALRPGTPPRSAAGGVFASGALLVRW